MCFAQNNHLAVAKNIDPMKDTANVEQYFVSVTSEALYVKMLYTILENIICLDDGVSVTLSCEKDNYTNLNVHLTCCKMYIFSVSKLTLARGVIGIVSRFSIECQK